MEMYRVVWRTLAAAALACAVGRTWATDGTWVFRAGVGTTPTNAASWMDTDNWVGGIIATNDGGVANFNVGTSSDTVWIRIPDGFHIGNIDNFKNDGMRGRFICEGTLYMKNNGGARIRGSDSNCPTVWADLISVDGAFGPYYASVCAPSESSTYTWSGGSVYHDAGMFATSTDEILANLITVGSYYQCNCQTPIYSRRTVAATTGTWDVTEGGRIAKWRSGGKGTTLSPGQTIHATGVFPDGTFLKRVYDDSFIEFSEPALATHDAGVAISFDAHSPQVKLSLPRCTMSDKQGFVLNKRTSSDVLDVTYESFDASDNRLQLYSYKDIAAGSGRNIFTDTSGLRKGLWTRWNTHIVLTATNDTGLCGLNGIIARTDPNGFYGTDTLEVGSGLDATLHEFTKDGSGTKDNPGLSKIGAGRLTVKSTQQAQYTFSAKEGTLVYAPAADGATLQTLNVSAGATFALAAGTSLTVSCVTMADGATLQVGEGATLTLQEKSFGSNCRILGPGTVAGLAAGGASSLILGDNIRLADAAASSTSYVATYPADVSAPCGDPAFWVDASKADTVILASGSDANVTRINDRRGTDAKYNFATNVASVYPTKNGDYVLMTKKGKSNIAETQALVWGRPITGIRAVFVLAHAQCSGDKEAGALLGSTARLGTRDFSKTTSGLSMPIVDNTGASCVINGSYYINGAARDRTAGRLGYFRQVLEIHPLAPGGEADAFGFQYGTTYDGNYWLGEVLVYTNALTYAERTQVAAYLMDKWIGGKVAYVDFPADGAFGKISLAGGATFGAAAGTEAEIDDIAGTGTLSTKGEGTFHLRRFANAAAGLRVTAGTTRLESYDPTSPAMIPADPQIHVDASDAASVTTNADGEITAWANLGDAATFKFTQGLYSAKRATLVADATTPNALPVADLGPLVVNTEEGLGATDELPSEKACYFGFYEAGSGRRTNFQARAIFGVMGSKDGGNWFLSGSEDARIYSAGFYRDATRTATDPILTSTSGNCSTTEYYHQFLAPVLKNGERTTLGATGYSGAYDTVGYWSPYAQEAWGLGRSWRRFWAGGLQVGEYFVYSRTLTEDEAYKLDAYLGAKWFNRVSTRYAKAVVGALAVDAGATLEIVGGAPVTAASISGAGTIDGDVVLAESAVLEVPVDDDGAITQVLTVSGGVDLSQGGTVRLTGSVDRLRRGQYKIVSSADLTALGAWSVTPASGRHTFALSVEADGLYLTVVKPGLAIILK